MGTQNLGNCYCEVCTCFFGRTLFSKQKCQLIGSSGSSSSSILCVDWVVAADAGGVPAVAASFLAHELYCLIIITKGTSFNWRS